MSPFSKQTTTIYDRFAGEKGMEVMLGHAPPGKTSYRTMHVGQKLRTALRGPPGRLVFKVGGGDGERFRHTRRFDGHRDGVWHVTVNSLRNICASASAGRVFLVKSISARELIVIWN
uniref:LAM_G_DOMAIN domain-containing protein n=1 Tax=Angiostrongylus cantonensis TaxID=6313 RepID=A0A0K0D2X4_ANGCA